jgi:hypothetical protein
MGFIILSEAIGETFQKKIITSVRIVLVKFQAKCLGDKPHHIGNVGFVDSGLNKPLTENATEYPLFEFVEGTVHIDFS